MGTASAPSSLYTLPSKSSAVLLVIYTLSSQSGKRHCWIGVAFLVCIITHLKIKSPTQHIQPYFSQFLRTVSRKCLLYPLVCGIPDSKGQDSLLFEVFTLPEP